MPLYLDYASWLFYIMLLCYNHAPLCICCSNIETVHKLVVYRLCMLHVCLPTTSFLPHSSFSKQMCNPSCLWQFLIIYITLPNGAKSLFTIIAIRAKSGLKLIINILTEIFDKLTDGNFHEWKIYMEALLMRKGLLDYVDGTERHPRGTEGPKKVKEFYCKQSEACAEVILHVTPSQLAHCHDMDPVIIWNDLITICLPHELTK